MPKFGKLTPTQWGPFMPAHSPISGKGPWYYRDTECMVFEFETDENWCLSVLPSDLELFEPATAFVVIERNHWTTLGPYSEFYSGILCKWKGEIYAYVPAVYVTGENSQIVGREVYGFGKKRAHRIDLNRLDSGEIEAIMEVHPGDRSLHARIRTSVNEPASAIGTLPLICLRFIPDAAGGPRPALAQLISVLFAANPIIGSDGKAEVYSGPGWIKFETPSDAQMPVKKILGAKYAHFNADLPYGKVLKTFGDADFNAK
jgi:acetoacetate decarboxylase